MGADRLPARPRLVHPPGGRAGRSPREAPHLPHRDGVVRGRVAGVRRRHRASECSSRPGSCKAWAARSSRRGAWRSCRPASASPTGRWPSAPGRPSGASPARSGPSSAAALVDGPGWRWAFLHQRSALCRGHRVRPHRGPREPGRARDRQARRPRRRVQRRRARRAATWALTEAGLRGWGDAGVRGRPDRRGRRHGRVRRPRPARAQPAGAAPALPQPDVHRREPRHPAALHRDRTDLLPRRVRAPGRRWVVRPRGRPRPPADHHPHARPLRPIRCPRPTDRTPPAAHRRTDPHRRRDAAAHPRRRRSHVGDRRPARARWSSASGSSRTSLRSPRP